MALPHRANAISHPSNLSVCPESEPLELVDKSLSDEDEVVWPTNSFDSEEDFILIPKSHSLPEPLLPLLSNLEASPPLEALSLLSLRDSASTIASTTPTFHFRKSRPKSFDYETHGSPNARSETGKLSSSSVAFPSAPKTHRVRRRRGKRDATSSYPSPSPSPERNLACNDSSSEESGHMDTILFGACPVVEDSDEECYPIFTKYEDAVHFITSFLSDPPTPCTTCTRLTFLQSLIIELGLISATSSLPSSLKSAKRLLKTHAFVNIGEYLSVREQGRDKLQEIMFTSRRELTRDLRRKKGSKKADRGWVKRHGLNVLLVSVF